MKHKITTENEKTKMEKIITTAKRNVSFPSLKSTIDFDFNAPHYLRRLKHSGSALIVTKILQRFRENEARDPSSETREDDLQKLASIRSEIANGLVPDGTLLNVFAQISPAAAIVGGELSQEIIKAVSQKEDPNHNYFFFDPNTCCGFVESIGN